MFDDNVNRLFHKHGVEKKQSFEEKDANERMPVQGESKQPFVLSISSNPKKYESIEKIAPFGKLPICVIISTPDASNSIKVKDSLESTGFPDWKYVHFLRKNKEGHTGDNTYVAKNFSFSEVKAAVDLYCQENSLVMVANEPVLPSALSSLNEIYQSSHTYMTYSVEEGSIQVHSFYRRVLELIELNDFGHRKKALYDTECSFMARALVELCRGKAHKVETGEIFEDEDVLSPIQISL